MRPSEIFSKPRSKLRSSSGLPVIVAVSDQFSRGVAEDALAVLTVAAGITLIALAFLIPAGLLMLLVALIRRLWIRRDRERALNQDQPS